MHLLRTIVLTTLAICLAVFPVGATRAVGWSPVGAGQVVAASHHHAHGGGIDRHESVSRDAEAHGASSQAMADRAEDCSHDGASAGACATCCGFACHAFQPVVVPLLGTPFARILEQAILQDEQVGLGLVSIIERPPKSV